MRTLPRVLLCGVLLAALVSARPARSQDGVMDKGTFKLSAGGRSLGAEVFTYTRAADSVVVGSEVYQTLPGAQGPDTLRKHVLLSMSAFDLGLRRYESKQELRGHSLVRTLVLHDSTLSSFREFDRQGEGDIYRLPPGHVFVLDGGVFMLFDVMCRSLAEHSFDRWPLQVVALGPRDSVLQASAEDLGVEPFAWGGRRVETRHLRFSDGSTAYDAWMTRDGRMLRLRQESRRVEVDREAPPVKPRARRPRGR